MSKELKQNHQRHFLPLLAQKKQMVKRHQQTRKFLAEKQRKRQQQETKKRQARLNEGIHSIWDRLTGKHDQIQKMNEIEAYQSYLRDQVEKDTLIFRQLEERGELQHRLDSLKHNQQEEINKLKEALFAKLPEEKITQLRQEFDRSPSNPEHHYDMNM